MEALRHAHTPTADYMAPEVVLGRRQGAPPAPPGGSSWRGRRSPAAARLPAGAPPPPVRRYGPACDLWSCGVVLHMLLSGEAPFERSSQPRQLRAICAGAYDLSGASWRGVSAEARDLVSRLLVVDPDQRLTAAHALQHPWLRRAGARPTAAERQQQAAG